jgi:hypothetical protein
MYNSDRALAASRTDADKLKAELRLYGRCFPVGLVAGSRRKKPWSSMARPEPSELQNRRKAYIAVLKMTSVMMAVHLGLEPHDLEIKLNGTTYPLCYAQDPTEGSSIPLPATLLDATDKEALQVRFAEIQASRDKFYITDRTTTEMFHLFPSVKGAHTSRWECG